MQHVAPNPEDVVKFEKAKGVNAKTRGSRAKENVGPEKSDQDEDPLTDASADESDAPKPKKKVRLYGYLSFTPRNCSRTLLDHIHSG